MIQINSELSPCRTDRSSIFLSVLHHYSQLTCRPSGQIENGKESRVQKMSSPSAEKMTLLLGIMCLVLASQEVGAQSGGKGHLATSLCDELITPNEYNCIEYEATTDDGFILGIQNIPSARGLGNAPNNGPPVLLQHGLTAGGDNWVVNGPQESLGFVLADAGFDVWITNSRTTQWSHGHENLTTSENAYWAWTYDELASYDLKTSTEFVYRTTGGKKLSYVGHSLGTTILVAGLTDGRFNTTVLGCLNAAVLLAPVVFLAHITPPAERATYTAYSSPAVYAAGAMEYSTYAEAQLACGPPAVTISPTACFLLFTAIIGNTSYTNVSRLGFYSQYFPQPTSTYNINHLGQGFVRDNFAFYDKGPKDNEAAYGQATAPNYDISSFPADLPVQYWAGGIDGRADPTDVAAVLALLPSSNREVHNLPDYGHTDFVLGYRAYIDVYPSLIAFLKKHV